MPLTFEEWFGIVEALFVEHLDYTASAAGWDWEHIFRNEDLSPEQVFEQYVETM